MRVEGGRTEGKLLLAEPAEDEWKQRFAKRLACLFEEHGLDKAPAVADAEAHANDHYPHRRHHAPEKEADELHRWLLAES